MQKEDQNKDYSKIRPMTRYIAEKTNCSVIYVRQVLKGERKGKTERATKYYAVVTEADKLLKAINN